ncbi:hypothetical protein DMA11_19345 [Marinilabiliaceae bacterium JC017]|nr:hypothetical protein DMA11_19345 [Marinilabiliaceae bacterium JC017]
MKRGIFLTGLLCMLSFAYGQENKEENGAEKILNSLSDKKLVIGGYGQIDYNQPLKSGTSQNGKLDVHRLVLLFGYQFNERTQLVTEVEYEHVKEVYIEQAFINYKIVSGLNFNGGLMLIPMGIINEYHEPTTYNGVERPNVDSYIVPTTWREIGAGFNGNIPGASLNYKLYVVNGFNGYSDDKGTLGGSKGLRSGRQKGAESYISSPNVSARVDYYGIPGLQVGLSGYFGKTQSELFHNLDKSDKVARAEADSSVVGVRMIGLDYRYKNGAFHSRGQLIYNSLTNTNQYNQFTGKDLGAEMLGAYVEVAYDLFRNNTSVKNELTPFVRYEYYDTHQNTDGIVANDKYKVSEIVAGLGYKVADGVVFKADMQFRKPASEDKFATTLNMGIGFWF